MAEPLIYPNSLPCPRVSDVTAKERRLTTAKGGDDGPLRTRVLQRDLLQREQAAFIFTFAQAELFRAWWKDTLIYGGCWFGAHWPLPQGVPDGGYRFRRFIGAPVWQSFLPGVGWAVQATFEVRGLGTPEVIDSGAAGLEIGWCEPVNEFNRETVAQVNAGTLSEAPYAGPDLFGGFANSEGLLAAAFTIHSWEPVVPGDPEPEVIGGFELPDAGMFILRFQVVRDDDGFIVHACGGVVKIACETGAVQAPGFLQAASIPILTGPDWFGYSAVEWMWVPS